MYLVFVYIKLEFNGFKFLRTMRKKIKNIRETQKACRKQMKEL